MTTAAVQPLLGFAVIDMPSWWGLSFAHTLLVVALLLFLVDIFFMSDVPTHIAYVLVAIVVGTTFDVHGLWQAVIGVVSWFALVGFHFLLWRRVLRRVAERIAPGAYKSGGEGLAGEQGRVRVVDGRRFVLIHGDLWKFDGADDAPEGAPVRILAQKETRLVVEPVAPPPSAGSPVPAGAGPTDAGPDGPEPPSQPPTG